MGRAAEMERVFMGRVAEDRVRPFQNAVWKEMKTWGWTLHNRGLYGDK